MDATITLCVVCAPRGTQFSGTTIELWRGNELVRTENGDYGPTGPSADQIHQRWPNATIEHR